MSRAVYNNLRNEQRVLIGVEACFSLHRGIGSFPEPRKVDDHLKDIYNQTKLVLVGMSKFLATT